MEDVKAVNGGEGNVFKAMLKMNDEEFKKKMQSAEEGDI